MSIQRKGLQPIRKTSWRSAWRFSTENRPTWRPSFARGRRCPRLCERASWRWSRRAGIGHSPETVEPRACARETIPRPEVRSDVTGQEWQWFGVFERNVMSGCPGAAPVAIDLRASESSAGGFARGGEGKRPRCGSFRGPRASNATRYRRASKLSLFAPSVSGSSSHNRPSRFTHCSANLGAESQFPAMK